MSHILIVDDEESICWALSRLYGEQRHRVSVASSAEEALRLAKSDPPDLIMLDVRLPGMDGLTAMNPLSKLVDSAPIVVMTAFGNLKTAVAALGNGAFDYLPKPFDLDQAADVARRALERRHVAGAVNEPTVEANDDEMVGSGPAMQAVFKRIALAAPTEASVLITGESGAGKELVARAIHRHSPRALRPLMPVNLAALNPDLVESELFGHVRGAFTGATSDRVGLLEMAAGGTVFLDEAADIPPAVQVKLLRTLEQQEITPVGDVRPRQCDFRVLAATHRDLRQEVRAGRFREDLYYRLAVFEIHLPPLRERRDDVPALAARFLRQCRPAGRSASQEGFSAAAMDELCRRPWPGNVRELRNAVEHAALLSHGNRIDVAHLPPLARLAINDVPPADGLAQAARAWARAQLANESGATELYERFLAAIEPALFDEVLEATSQNRVAASQILGIHRGTLRKKLAGP